MTTISTRPATPATPDHAGRAGGPRMRADGTRAATRTDARAGAREVDLAHLDEPCAAIAAAGDASASRTYRDGEGQRVVGMATLSRQLPPGPPLRGAYRIHDVAAQTAGDAAGAIARCVAHAAAKEGRTLWCHAALAAVDVWRQHGFTVAGPPSATRGGGVGVLMVRRLAPADAGS